MTTRTFLYQRLVSFPGLMALIGDGVDPANSRVFAKKTMTSNVEDTPYIVYKLGYNANEDISDAEGFVNPERQFIQIFVHDFSDGETADYMKIDQVIAQLKLALVGQVSPEDGIVNIRYLETSQDLNDDTLNTVMKYARFQVIEQGDDNG